MTRPRIDIAAAAAEMVKKANGEGDDQWVVAGVAAGALSGRGIDYLI
jgi:hypothetical protein